jgi:hypothetical protein
MKTILLSCFIIIISLAASAQDVQQTGVSNQTQDRAYSYAYISVEGKLFSKKLKVQVDFGDTPEQISAGKEYSEILTNKKSYAAILNYMVESQFELVETLDHLGIYQGTGETDRIVFIMRKRK